MDGLPLASQFLADIVFPPAVQIQATLTAANRQPALAVYSRRHDGDPWQATGLLVLTVRGNRIAAVTRFEPDRQVRARTSAPEWRTRVRHYDSDMSASVVADDDSVATPDMSGCRDRA